MRVMRAALACALVAASMLALTVVTGTTAQAATTKVVRYGPFTVPGMSMQMFDAPAPKPCDGCNVTKIAPQLVYADGSRANYNTDAMLHHIVLFNESRTDLTCPNGVGGGMFMGERFFASGNERTVFDTSQFGITPFGYRVNTGDQWSILAELMKMSMDPQDLYVDVTYNTTTSSVRPVKPLWLDIDLCGDSEVDAMDGTRTCTATGPRRSTARSSASAATPTTTASASRPRTSPSAPTCAPQRRRTAQDRLPGRDHGVLT